MDISSCERDYKSKIKGEGTVLTKILAFQLLFLICKTKRKKKQCVNESLALLILKIIYVLIILELNPILPVRKTIDIALLL